MGLYLTLITNETKVTPQLVEQLGRLPLAISVSLDTLNRETHQRIRGADQCSKRFWLNRSFLKDWANRF